MFKPHLMTKTKQSTLKAFLDMKAASRKRKRQNSSEVKEILIIDDDDDDDRDTESDTHNDNQDNNQQIITTSPLTFASPLPETSSSPSSSSSSSLLSFPLDPSQMFLYPPSSSSLPSSSPFNCDISTSDGCRIIFIRDFLSPSFSEWLYNYFSAIPMNEWSTGTLYGHPIPRVSRWYAEAGYRYANQTWPSFPYPNELAIFQDALYQHILKYLFPACTPFKTLLVNYYRNGQDSISKHADKESVLGVRPSIASITLGATRTFWMARKPQKAENENNAHNNNNNHNNTAASPHKRQKSMKFELVNGSLLLMAGRTQEEFQHWIVKEPKVKHRRYNLTFRPWLHISEEEAATQKYRPLPPFQFTGGANNAINKEQSRM